MYVNVSPMFSQLGDIYPTLLTPASARHKCAFWGSLFSMCALLWQSEGEKLYLYIYMVNVCNRSFYFRVGPTHRNIILQHYYWSNTPLVIFKKYKYSYLAVLVIQGLKSWSSYSQFLVLSWFRDLCSKSSLLSLTSFPNFLVISLLLIKDTLMLH